MSESVDEMLHDAIALHQSARLDQARELYEAILRLDEKNPNALNLLGMVHLVQGRHEHAAELVTRAIEVAPNFPGFYNNLGTVRLAQRRAAEAEEPLRRAVALQADYVEAVNNLGVALIGQGKIDEAMKQFVRAIELRHAYPSARNNLGNALRAKRMYAQAVDCYRDAIALKPDHAESWANMAIALLEKNDLPAAEEASRKAIALRPEATGAYYTLGLALEELGRMDEAAEQYRAALKLRPGMASLRFQLAALTGEEKFDAAPPDFVASLFDNYADTFDRHLCGTLSYRGPQALMDALESCSVRGPLDVIDLGCGTGLCGPLLRPMARLLVGVDLSSRMIHHARERKVYDDLFVDEIVTFLAARKAGFDLAVAADVFCYVGDLSAMFGAISEGLRPGGLIAFTVERHDGEGFVLNPTRRYSHSIAYVRSLLPAAHFTETLVREGGVRTQMRKDVPAWTVVLKRA